MTRFNIFVGNLSTPVFSHCRHNCSSQGEREGLDGNDKGLQKKQSGFLMCRYFFSEWFVLSKEIRSHSNFHLVSPSRVLVAQLDAYFFDVRFLQEGGCFHSRTAVGMFDHVKEAVDKGEVLLEWDYSKVYILLHTTPFSGGVLLLCGFRLVLSFGCALFCCVFASRPVCLSICLVRSTGPCLVAASNGGLCQRQEGNRLTQDIDA